MSNIDKYTPQGELSRSRYEPRNLDELKDYAKIIIQSGLCPSHIQKPADALLVIQRGAEMGLTAINSLQNMFVISGKVSMSAQLAVGICKASPLCKYFQCVENEPDRVTWETHRVGNPQPTRITFTKDDAQRAGLWGKGMWAKYPKNMMSARASINLARMEYSDLLAGIYTPEELGADDEPAPIQTRTQPTLTGEPGAPRQRPEPEVVDAEFEESPAPAAKKAQPRKSMRADSASKQMDQYAARYSAEKSAREKQRADAARIAAGDFGAGREKGQPKSAGSASDGWRAVSTLIHEVTRSNADRFKGYAAAIYQEYGVESYSELTVEQLRTIWRELNALSAQPGNGGASGEISPREEYLLSLGQIDDEGAL